MGLLPFDLARFGIATGFPALTMLIINPLGCYGLETCCLKSCCSHGGGHDLLGGWRKPKLDQAECSHLRDEMASQTMGEGQQGATPIFLKDLIFK